MLGCASIARSLSFTPYADLLWMESKTPMLAEAKQFADGVHSAFPHAMLAYNLSPSFNWSAAGLLDDDIQRLQTELGKLGFWSHNICAYEPRRRQTEASLIHANCPD